MNERELYVAIMAHLPVIEIDDKPYLIVHNYNMRGNYIAACGYTAPWDGLSEMFMQKVFAMTELMVESGNFTICNSCRNPAKKGRFRR